MSKATELKLHLQPGQVYRRNDLEKWSNAVDRHLQELQDDGTLKKVAKGMYYYPTETAFGQAPPSDDALVRSFLKDDRFLVTSPNDYNKLGLGTTQLYNKAVVYNHKRHGELRLGNRFYSFQRKPHFPKKVSPEFLLVDLVNNVDSIAEDKTAVLHKVKKKVSEMNVHQLKQAVRDYGNLRTKRFFAPILGGNK